MKVYILVVHYKNPKDTINCLNSILALNTKNINTRLIVLDNDRDNRVKQYIRKELSIKKNLKVIENDKNLGYAKAINIGVKEALTDKADYVLIINNDIILPPNFLTDLLSEEKDIIGPVIKFKSKEGKWVYDFGGKVNWWTGRTKHIEKTSSVKYLSQAKSGGLISNIDYISGCCMLVRNEVFREVGLFDEDYFFYFEDVDFCVRSKKKGFTITINPNVHTYHKLSASIGRWSWKAIFYNIFSNATFIRKHFKWRMVIAYIYISALTFKIIIDKLLDR